jgi:hypothetical protein
MDASGQSLLIGDPLQDTSQRGLLVFRQRGQQGLLVFTRDLADGLQSRFPFLSQVQRVAAPVALVSHRVALYSSQDDVIAGRTSRWPHLADAYYDMPWLTHDTDAHKEALTRLIVAYMSGSDLGALVQG